MTKAAKPSAATRWICVCSYDGGAFAGWQSQPGGRAVQDVIEHRLKAVFGRDIRIHGSGRTDAGVHALGQVFHFDAEWTHGAEKLRKALQSRLPRAILLKKLRAGKPGFHSRFDAKGKVYRYDLYLGEPDPFTAPFCWALNRPLDIPAMNAAAAVLRGKHDFKAFSADNGSIKETTVRHLRRLELSRRGPRLRLTFEADGFLYKMARSLTGALVNAGYGKLTVPEIAGMLKSANRPPQVLTAPPQGLFLVKVRY